MEPGEDPMETARRELIEETGFTAQNDRIKRVHLYNARVYR